MVGDDQTEESGRSGERGQDRRGKGRWPA